MIDRMNHTTIFVLDQDSAKDFYVNKLGFELKTDAKMDNGFRWLTVAPKGQPDFEIVLMATDGTGSVEDESGAKIRELVKAGKLGAGVFSTSDLQKTYEDLVAKGVHFKKLPTKEFYGFEAVFQDDSGNWFSLSQPL
jgi:catechol 2,3-dioxygenase-like lactoylglutathione lyase family enzyme